MTSRITFIALTLSLSCLASAQAFAGATNGPSALALAALVGDRAPQVVPLEKRLLAAFLDGHAEMPHPKGKNIVVKADSIDCRASNVDVTQHACTLAFGDKKIELVGRKAHELYATLVENGVAADGAAGSIHVAVTALDCQVDADEVREKAGGGARCAFNP
ncbi:hypothetical protein LG047_09380 [Methylocystis sp. WRRC1]|uniref:hypothetical protein n=1 Tax=Methylocystis sp. WRRC1 TaxID=1732014 RepID=UPI001D14D9EF|nr:hypothetical protein [Methylocystis sp. WRRC1]MCC3245530.1 hypothetical protein [Methylocystis sp. WRRC1]